MSEKMSRPMKAVRQKIKDEVADLDGMSWSEKRRADELMDEHRELTANHDPELGHRSYTGDEAAAIESNRTRARADLRDHYDKYVGQAIKDAAKAGKRIHFPPYTEGKPVKKAEQHPDEGVAELAGNAATRDVMVSSEGQEAAMHMVRPREGSFAEARSQTPQPNGEDVA